MPLADESIGYGSTIFIDDGTENAYVQVFNLVTLTPPAETLGTTESKRLDSPGRVIGSVPTMFDPGDMSARFDFTSAEFARLETIRKARAKRNFKVTVVDDDAGTVVIVPGYITQNKVDTVEADKITQFDCMIKVCGAAS